MIEKSRRFLNNCKCPEIQSVDHIDSEEMEVIKVYITEY